MALLITDQCVECIFVDPDRIETQEQLLAKSARLTSEETA
jgi:hypothetical protein